MATKERPEQEEDALVPAGRQELAPEETEEPAAPKGISEEEAQELKGRASELVNELEEASGSRELELVDGISNMGLQAQRGAGAELELLRGRVGEMMTSEGPGGGITNDLAELRLALNQINPHELGREGVIRRAFRMIPFFGNFTPALRVLERIAIRYEPVSMQVRVIETRLRDGRAMLTRDNIELRKLYEQVENQQLPIQKNAYMGELAM